MEWLEKRFDCQSPLASGYWKSNDDKRGPTNTRPDRIPPVERLRGNFGTVPIVRRNGSDETTGLSSSSTRKWEDMERLMEQVRFHWSTRGCQLPKNLKNPQNKGPTFNGRCYRCGSPKHIRANCRKRDIRCLYPLCLEPDTHHLCVCPTLHNGCHECKRRGHRLSHHNSFSLPVLEEVFLNFSPGGVYTSVPWFEFEEERAGKLCAQFWYFGLYFRGRENSKKLFRRMGLNYVPLKK